MSRNLSALTGKGFVLVSTLWVVVVLILMVLAFENYISNKIERAHEIRERVSHSIDMLATEQVLRYLLASRRQTLAGLDFQNDNWDHLRNDSGLISLDAVGGELRLDGRVYKGFGDVLFSIQDESGLVAINAADAFVLKTFLGSAGLSDIEISVFTDMLQDYWDANDFRRLNGAERNDYVQNNMLPPSNDYLRSHVDVQKVLGWKDWLKQPSRIDALRLFTANRSPQVNFNTVPFELLKFFHPDPEAIIALREKEPFRSVDGVKAQFPLLRNWPGEGFLFLAGSRVRIELWVEGRTQAEVIGLELSPFDRYEPLREHYRFHTNSPGNIRLASEESQNIFERFKALPAQ